MQRWVQNECSDCPFPGLHSPVPSGDTHPAPRQKKDVAQAAPPIESTEVASVPKCNLSRHSEMSPHRSKTHLCHASAHMLDNWGKVGPPAHTPRASSFPLLKWLMPLPAQHGTNSFSWASKLMEVFVHHTPPQPLPIPLPLGLGRPPSLPCWASQGWSVSFLSLN